MFVLTAMRQIDRRLLRHFNIFSIKVHQIWKRREKIKNKKISLIITLFEKQNL